MGARARGRDGSGARRAGLAWLVLGLVASACGPSGSGQGLRLSWEPDEVSNRALPSGIRVFAASDPTLPLRAWQVRVDEPDAAVTTRVVVSADDDRRETASSFARRLGARVVVNGGYFRSDREPTRHVGLLLVGGTLIEPAIDSILRRQRRYHVTRAALGLTEEGGIDVAWVSSRRGVLYAWPAPPPNLPERPVEALVEEGLPSWSVRNRAVRDAVAGGPALVSGGRIRITSDEEVFFGTPMGAAHPRTAAGYTARGELVLVVVDGRQPASRGVDLRELAALMRDLGCVEALNLDGGGSSTLVVDGRLVNRPLGGGGERQVMSALAVFDQPV